MEIRVPRKGEGLAIARVHVTSWQTTYKGIIKQDVLDNLAVEPRAQYWESMIEKQLLGDSDHELLFVACNAEQEIVGFASGGSNRSQDLDAEGELYAIYILEEYQRQGIGKRLITQVAQALKNRGQGTMLVWVLADNPAKEAYEKLGATVINSTYIDIGGDKLLEYALIWKDIDVLLTHKAG